MGCYCIKCHCLMHLAAIRDSLPVAWLCQRCYSVWQINIDPELLRPRYA